MSGYPEPGTQATASSESQMVRRRAVWRVGAFALVSAIVSVSRADDLPIACRGVEIDCSAWNVGDRQQRLDLSNVWFANDGTFWYPRNELRPGESLKNRNRAGNAARRTLVLERHSSADGRCGPALGSIYLDSEPWQSYEVMHVDRDGNLYLLLTDERERTEQVRKGEEIGSGDRNGRIEHLLKINVQDGAVRRLRSWDGREYRALTSVRDGALVLFGLRAVSDAENTRGGNEVVAPVLTELRDTEVRDIELPIRMIRSDEIVRRVRIVAIGQSEYVVALEAQVLGEKRRSAVEGNSRRRYFDYDFLWVGAISGETGGILWERVLNGSFGERLHAVAWDPWRRVLFLAGTTESPDFAGVDEVLHQKKDAGFLVALESEGKELKLLRFGGADFRQIVELRILESGEPLVLGVSCSDDFPSGLCGFESLESSCGVVAVCWEGVASGAAVASLLGEELPIRQDALCEAPVFGRLVKARSARSCKELRLSAKEGCQSGEGEAARFDSRAVEAGKRCRTEMDWE